MTSPTESPQQIQDPPQHERSADSPGAAHMARLFIVAASVVALTLITVVAGQIFYG